MIDPTLNMQSNYLNNKSFNVAIWNEWYSIQHNLNCTIITSLIIIWRINNHQYVNSYILSTVVPGKLDLHMVAKQNYTSLYQHHMISCFACSTALLCNRTLWLDNTFHVTNGVACKVTIFQLHSTWLILYT